MDNRSGGLLDLAEARARRARLALLLDRLIGWSVVAMAASALTWIVFYPGRVSIAGFVALLVVLAVAFVAFVVRLAVAARDGFKG